MSYAYIYRDPISNEPFYVGKGNGKRAYVHLRKTHNARLSLRLAQLDVKGLLPHIEIIEAIDDEHAKFLEVCLIDVIGRQDQGRGPLYNQTDGGDGLSSASAQTRQKMAEAKLGKRRAPFSEEWCANIAQSQKGKTPSVETRAKLSASVSAARTGTKLSAETIAKRTATRKRLGSCVGRKHSEETRRKMSESLIRRYAASSDGA